MKVSIVINSAALAPHADITLSSGHAPYSWRAYALRNFILPSYLKYPDVEIIVAGTWEEGPGYTYIPVPQEFKSWRDCIAQRQAGFEVATGDLIIHQHDDHILEPRSLDGAWDVLVPQRWTRLRNPEGERLNHGEPEVQLANSVMQNNFNPSAPIGYIGGHCAIYYRKVLEACPWKDVPQVFTLDCEHTKQVRAAGFKIEWASQLRVYDVENSAEPWR